MATGRRTKEAGPEAHARVCGRPELGVETGIRYSSTSKILLSCQGKIKTHKYFKNSPGLSNRIREDKKVSETLCFEPSQWRWSISDASGGPCGPREFEGKADLYVQ